MSARVAYLVTADVAWGRGMIALCDSEADAARVEGGNTTVEAVLWYDPRAVAFRRGLELLRWLGDTRPTHDRIALAADRGWAGGHPYGPSVFDDLPASDHNENT